MGLGVQGHCNYCRRFSLGCYNCDILLDDQVLQPPKAITGRVKLHNPQNKSIKHHGIFVQLEAKLILRHETSTSQGKNVYSAAKSILEGNVDESITGQKFNCKLMEPTPIRDDSMMTNCTPVVSTGERLTSHPIRPFYRTRPRETTTLPFCLRFPQDMHDMPAPFLGQFGTLTYFVVAYIKSPECNPLAAGTAIKFEGFKNLFESAALLPSLSHTSGFKKSFLSKENSITAVLTVVNGDAGGFLPGEEVAFTVAVCNPKAFMVMGITVALIRKSRYKFEQGGSLVKECGERITSQKIHKDATRSVELLKPGKVTIPKNSGISYTRNENYNVTFHLQYEVNVVEFGNKPLGGFVEILVGSARPDEEITPIPPAVRSSPMTSIIPTITPRTTNRRRLQEQDDRGKSSLLPSYSQLFPQSMSLETLPPHYDDVMKE